MAITRDDILFAFDAGLAAANGGVPVVGGEPTFERSSSAYRLTRNKKFVPVVRDTPRFQLWPANDGIVYPVMVLERAATQRITGPFDATDAANSSSGGISFAARDSVIESQSAQAVTDDGSNGFHNLRQVFGSLPSSMICASVIIETESADKVGVNLRDETAGSSINEFNVDLSTLAIEDTSSPAGTDPVRKVISLGRGPNGGKLIQIVAMARPSNSGNSGALWFYPTGRSVTQAAATIVHYWGVTDTDYMPMPFDGTLNRDEWQAPGFAYESFAARISWVAEASSEVAADTNSVVANIGEPSDGLRLTYRASSGRFWLALFSGGTSIAGDFNAFTGVNSNPGDFLEVFLAVDDESQRLVAEIFLNGTSAATHASSFSSAFGGFGQNIVKLSGYQGGSNGAGMMPVNCDCVSISAVDSNYQSLTDTELREKTTLAMRNLVLDGQGNPL